MEKNNEIQLTKNKTDCNNQKMEKFSTPPTFRPKIRLSNTNNNNDNGSLFPHPNSELDTITIVFSLIALL